MYVLTYDSIALHSYLMPMCNCQDFNLVHKYIHTDTCKMQNFLRQTVKIRKWTFLPQILCSLALCFMIAFPAANSKGFNSVKFLNKNKQILSLAPFSRTSLLIRESFSSLTGVFQKIFGEKPSPCHSFCYTVVAIVDISGRISVLIFLLLSM